MAKHDQDLFDKLRASGVRKRVARSLSEASHRAGGSRKAPKSARRALDELRSIVGDVEDRISGGPAKRSLASKKAAATRKRKAEKRSAAAKKAARSRARR